MKNQESGIPKCDPIPMPNKIKTMTTKKEILQWIKTYTPQVHNDYDKGYAAACNFLKLYIQELPEDEWIRFDERMPSDEDEKYPIIISDGTGISLFNDYYKGVEQVYSSTHWKRIILPQKQLPTKAQILEKLGLSEEELKEIIK